MAYTKILVIHKRLDKALHYVQNKEKTSLSDAIDYALNRDKTERSVFETGINCDTETAYQDMMATKRRWGKADRIRQGYHIIQSFVPGEVTPEEAHAVGVEFAQQLLGNRYEVIVTTHLDKDHLHNHIVFNSVSFTDGIMYRNQRKDYFGEEGIGIRGTSDAICQRHNLSVIEPSKPLRGSVHRAEWEAVKKGKPNSRELVRQDIEIALSRAYTMDTFWQELKQMGYKIKRGPTIKHTAVRPAWAGNNFRLDSLGKGYTETELQDRLAAIRSGETPPPKVSISQPIPISPLLVPGRRYRVRGNVTPYRPRKLKGFRALYFKYLYFLRAAPIRRPKNRAAFLLREEVLRFDRYQEQFSYLMKKRIETAEQLSMQYDALQAEIDALTDRRSELYKIRRSGHGGDAISEEIAGLTRQLRPLRRELKLCVRIEGDIPKVETSVRQATKEHSKEKTREKPGHSLEQQSKKGR